MDVIPAQAGGVRGSGPVLSRGDPSLRWGDVCGEGGRRLRAELGALDPEAVLNGIAWDAGAKRLFVTGKWWPTLFEIALEPVPSN